MRHWCLWCVPERVVLFVENAADMTEDRMKGGWEVRFKRGEEERHLVKETGRQDGESKSDVGWTRAGSRSSPSLLEEVLTSHQPQVQ